MVVSDIQLHELLKGKIGAKEAEAFVEILDRRVEKKFEEKKDMLATKQDIADIRVSIADLRSEVNKNIFIASVGQYLAIVGSVLAIVTYMAK